jgi:SAM-dependent methyltransferase
VGLTNSPEAVDLASAAYPARNLSYQRVDLPALPYSESYFDALVTFGVVENLSRPEDLIREAKRVLKKDGVLVISTLDKQTQPNGGDHGGIDDQRREMYVPEFQELLERYFGGVHIYRQGAVAGGFVFPVSEKVTSVPVSSARFSTTTPDLGAQPPTTRSVIAVCTEVEALGQEEQPYLLLDRDRHVFDECQDRAEDVELMRSEIQRMQETEVQAFLDALRVQQSLYYILKRYPIHLRNIIHTIRTESRMYRRLSTPYRWLRAKSGSS